MNQGKSRTLMKRSPDS